jgi:hypothetical protein
MPSSGSSHPAPKSRSYNNKDVTFHSNQHLSQSQITIVLAKMHSIIPLLSLLALAQAVPNIGQRGDKLVHILYRHDKSSNKMSLTVTDESKTKIHGRSCSMTLDDGAFASIPIAIKVDGTGEGDLKLGSSAYKIPSARDGATGASCWSVYNQDEESVDCAVPWTSAVELTDISTNATQCFDSSQVTARSLEERLCNFFYEPVPVGDGNPHQNFLHKQISVCRCSLPPPRLKSLVNHTH